MGISLSRWLACSWTLTTAGSRQSLSANEYSTNCSQSEITTSLRRQEGGGGGGVELVFEEEENDESLLSTGISK